MLNPVKTHFFPYLFAVEVLKLTSQNLVIKYRQKGLRFLL